MTELLARMKMKCFKVFSKCSSTEQRIFNTVFTNILVLFWMLAFTLHTNTKLFYKNYPSPPMLILSYMLFLLDNSLQLFLVGSW